jgi:glycosyltransferase involved in cell wall biosynthesis
MSVKRVLHLIDTEGPGGAETVFLDLIKGLDPQEWKSFPVVGAEGWLQRELLSSGFEPIVLRSLGSFNVHYAIAISRLVRRLGIDLIHAHLFSPAIYGGFVGALHRVPVIATFHGEVDVTEGDPYIDTKVRALDASVSRVAFVSSALQSSFLARYPIDPARAITIPNGIDVDFFRMLPDRSIRSALNLRDDDIVVGAVGNIRPAKRYDVFLDAAARLAQYSDRYHFVIAGHWHGEIDPALVSRIERSGLQQKVHFIGFRDDVRAVFNNLDVYVTTSDSEGFSLSTVQALACRVPVVATRSGGPETIITHDVHGLLVPTGDAASIAAATHAVCQDPDMRQRITEAGRTLVEQKYDVKLQQQSYTSVYRRMITEPRPNRAKLIIPALSGIAARLGLGAHRRTDQKLLERESK